MLDTPTRAKTCGRPQTRRWLELVQGAQADEKKAARLRAELNRYLSNADLQASQRAARRAARSGAEAQSSSNARPAVASGEHRRPPTKPRDTMERQSEQGEEPEIEDWAHVGIERIERVIATKDTAWTERVSALRVIASSETEITTSIANSICVQLEDLRSKVVVEACDVVKLRTTAISRTDALNIASRALGCVAVKKAVMANARESAAISALSPLFGDDDAWTAVVHHLQNQPTERARAVTVRAVTAWVPKISANRDVQLSNFLTIALSDRGVTVREAAKLLFTTFKTSHGNRANGLRELLPSSVRGRLPSDKKAGGSSAKLSIREQIRARRAAMAKEKQGGAGFDKGLGEVVTNRSIAKSTEPLKKKPKLDATGSPSDKENRV